MKLIDIRTAFLNAKIDKEIYVEQPKGFETGKDKVCRLQKALYGARHRACLTSVSNNSLYY